MKPARINEKITAAKNLYAAWGKALRADSGISAQLDELSARIAASREMGVRSGVASACRQCDRQDGGSCCGAGIENRYSPELLLINLLLGAALPESASPAGGCRFLGRCGCTLAAREILCVNYICARLQKIIPHRELVLLQEANGSEMELLFLLHERIRNFIRQKNS